MKKILFKTIQGKIIIGIIIIFAIITIGIISYNQYCHNKDCSYINKPTEDSSKGIETEYTAYVEINPLVKLIFKVLCQEEICNDPIITHYELVNEDAKKIYSDLDLKGNTLQDTISLLGSTAKNKGVEFNGFNIHTDWGNDNYFEENINDWEVNLIIIDKNKINEVPEEIENKKPKTDALKTLGILGDYWTWVSPDIPQFHLKLRDDYTFVIDKEGRSYKPGVSEEVKAQYKFFNDLTNFKEGIYELVSKDNTHQKIKLKSKEKEITIAIYTFNEAGWQAVEFPTSPLGLTGGAILMNLDFDSQIMEVPSFKYVKP